MALSGLAAGILREPAETCYGGWVHSLNWLMARRSMHLTLEPAVCVASSLDPLSTSLDVRVTPVLAAYLMGVLQGADQ